MAASPVATPNVLVGPGYLFIAPVGTAVPDTTSTSVVAGAYTSTWAAPWLPLGATEEGTEFSYSTEVEGVEVAEFFDPIRYETVSREGSVTFNLADYTAANLRRALNGGITPPTPTSGTGATASYTVAPPAPGTEVRAMIGWESLDNSVRWVAYRTIQGGEVNSSFAKAPDLALIPCTFNLEVPSDGIPFRYFFAGSTRGGV